MTQRPIMHMIKRMMQYTMPSRQMPFLYAMNIGALYVRIACKDCIRTSMVGVIRKGSAMTVLSNGKTSLPAS